MAERINLSEALRKLRNNKTSDVSYSVRKYREENPNPYRDGANSSRRFSRF